MNVLILGSGGREHTIAHQISKSPGCNTLFVAPGNAGTSSCATNLKLDILNFEEVAKSIKTHEIQMLIVGPEAPLVEGIKDYFDEREEFSDLKIVGPSKRGALLEGSKERAKEFMKSHQVPTAAYQSFSEKTLEAGKEFLKTMHPPYVLKADGLAGGKGVLILTHLKEAQDELENMLTNSKFGIASEKVVIEEFLNGIELSVFVLTDGKNYITLPNAKDYKRIGEADTGLNTGGMGAISPVPFADEAFMRKVDEKIIKPSIDGLYKEDIDFTGFLFIGLMKVGDEPFVVEYNVRMGDPETEVVIPRIKNDLLDVLSKTTEGKIQEVQLEIDAQHAATVMLVSGGYPGTYEKGKVVSGLDKTEEDEKVFVCHAGTKKENDQVLTNGGRVIAVTAFGDTFQRALEKAYENVNHINFKGMYYRKDLGKDLV
ncbi:phosphoribosylamine--glycine ligase [Psychroflexus sp. CAK57W]|uniref:phosphoribosylamine--glycine ligase n=1 Tax=Psychroflexus curvus TaxID=2873595 RepID=UPI001CCE9A2A|nr:phosphoribosylamine--glycine ligase [Psychroflexus curvus]MBZ9627035.1 phosphoribosylamine--glycine ligase [Psychroflexus curvus]MBZ9787041.1 phosphoribosylamine--glycine ligase [Psychroflexus curvus]